MNRILKTLLLFVFALGLSAPVAAHAQSYGLYQNCQLQTAQGAAVAGAQVYFLTQPANTSNLTPQAQVYSSSTGGAVTQPLITDGFGSCSAYLSPGLYTVVYISPFTGTRIFPDQAVLLPSGGSGTLINPITQIEWPIASGPSLPTSLCPTATTGSLTSGSATIIVASTSNIYVGQLVTGTGVPSGTYVLSTNTSASTVALTQNATNTASGVSLSFFSIGQPFQNTSNSQEYFCAENGWTSTGVQGSGTTGYLPKFTGTTSIGDSLVDEGITTANTLTIPEFLVQNTPTLPGVGGVFPFVVNFGPQPVNSNQQSFQFRIGGQQGTTGSATAECYNESTCFWVIDDYSDQSSPVQIFAPNLTSPNNLQMVIGQGPGAFAQMAFQYNYLGGSDSEHNYGAWDVSSALPQITADATGVVQFPTTNVSAQVPTCLVPDQLTLVSTSQAFATGCPTYLGSQFGVGAPGATGPTFVQANTNGGGDSEAFATSVTSGNVSIVEFQTTGSISGIGVTDTLGTSYTLKASHAGTGGAPSIAVFAGSLPSSGADTVTITSPPGSSDMVGVSEVANITTTIDTSSGSSATTTGADGSRLFFSITTANSPDYIFATSGTSVSYDPITTYAPFTVDSQNGCCGRTGAQMISHAVVTGPGSTYLWSSVIATNPYALFSGLLVGFEAKADCVNGAEYFDTSTTPYTAYVCNGGTWDQAGTPPGHGAPQFCTAQLGSANPNTFASWMAPESGTFTALAYTIEANTSTVPPVYTVKDCPGGNCSSPVTAFSITFPASGTTYNQPQVATSSGGNVTFGTMSFSKSDTFYGSFTSGTATATQICVTPIY